MTADDDSRDDADVKRGSFDHIPVLLTEVLEVTAPSDGDVIVDATFGAGGYTRAILEAANCRVIAFDRDPSAINAAEGVSRDFPGRFDFVQAPFAELDQHLAEPVDAVVFDIGVSSMQLDDADRGFSFMSPGPLDMRMFAARGNVPEDGPDAAHLVNTLEADDLADLIFHLGEERRARQIARAIVRERETAPLTTTTALADLVARVYGRPPRDGRHPATRTFQALRIAVNDELRQLAQALYAAETMLRPGGRLVVVTFHSLEDRIAKRFFTVRSGRTSGGSRHRPEMIELSRPSFRLVNHRPLTPGNEEVTQNPRARSAKLRWGIRTEAPAPPPDYEGLGLPGWHPP
jgi:16S rRNA (cytosine1402-N4)-methyltransferase